MLFSFPRLFLLLNLVGIYVTLGDDHADGQWNNHFFTKGEQFERRPVSNLRVPTGSWVREAISADGIDLQGQYRTDLNDLSKEHGRWHAPGPIGTSRKTYTTVFHGSTQTDSHEDIYPKRFTAEEMNPSRYTPMPKYKPPSRWGRFFGHK